SLFPYTTLFRSTNGKGQILYLPTHACADLKMNLYKQKVLTDGLGTVYIAVASFTLEGKLLAEMWPRGFFTSLIITSGKVGASVGRPQLVGSPQYYLPPSLSLVTAPVACIDSIIHSMPHPPLQWKLT